MPDKPDSPANPDADRPDAAEAVEPDNAPGPEAATGPQTDEPATSEAVDESASTPETAKAESNTDGARSDASGDDAAPKTDPLTQSRDKAREFEEAYFRARAELENYRRRMAREKQEFMKVAAANVIEDLLPVFDNLELGLQAARQHPDAKDITYGFEMVVSQFTNILGEHGLKKLEPVGEAFDPNLHEATSHEASDDYDEGQVSACLRAGYQLNDRLLRPATVVVSKGATDGAADDAASAAGEAEDKPQDKG